MIARIPRKTFCFVAMKRNFSAGSEMRNAGHEAALSLGSKHGEKAVGVAEVLDMQGVSRLCYFKSSISLTGSMGVKNIFGAILRFWRHILNF